jgi:hypothetical protein
VGAVAVARWRHNGCKLSTFTRCAHPMMMFPQGSGVMPAAARRPSGVGSPAQPFASRITGFFVCISIGWLVFLVQYFGDDGSSGTGHYHQVQYEANL